MGQDVVRSLGQLDEAKAACDRALAIDPANAGALEEARHIEEILTRCEAPTLHDAIPLLRRYFRWEHDT